MIKMSLAQTFLLATVQGVSEFLPISSSGHLALLYRLLRIQNPPATFVVLVHSGTLFAALAFFYNDFRKLLKESPRTTVVNVLVASLPAAFIGLFLSPFLNQLLVSAKIVALGFTGTSFLLFLSHRLKIDQGKIGHLSPKQAFIIGLFQAGALIPGLSRSGATLFAGQQQGLNSSSTLTFSFLLFVPATLGAALLTFVKDGLTALSFAEIIVGLFTPFLTGYFSLTLLRYSLRRDKLYLFSSYCLLLAIISLTI